VNRDVWVLIGLVAVMTTVAVLGLPRWVAVITALLGLAVAVGALRLERTARRPAAASASIEDERAGAAGSARELATLLDHVGEGVLLLDADERVLLANDEAARLLGRERSAIEQVTLIRAVLGIELLQVLREATGTVTDISLGDGRFLQASATRIESGDVRYVLTMQDLTRLRRAERARRDLVSNLSHELRTPLTAARALAETLAEGVGDERTRERFHVQLNEQIERLSDMVERLLRLSRIESQVERFELTTVEPRALFASAADRVAPIAGRRSVEVDETLHTNLAVVADPERALEVLENLLVNAIEHSPEGGRVLVEAHEETDAVRFEVSDDGPGVLPRDRPRVFERFYTGEESRQGAGTGLGLAIAKHIVTRLQGEIWVTDRTPGATFAFTLPRADRVDVADAERIANEAP
jgi:signal transduction histidine kinase